METRTVKRLSEREKEEFKPKLDNLNDTIAPTTLPPYMRRTIFLQLETLLALLPTAFWSHFELLAHLPQALKEKTKDEHIGHDPVQCVYSYLKSEKLLTKNPYVAAICVPTSQHKMVDENEKYHQYQALIILSCLQLHVVGQHESAIQHALREIRLIVTDAEHRPLLALLPSMDSNTSGETLIQALQELRKQSGLPLIQRGLAFLTVAISDAYQMTKGITRHRKVKYSPSQEEKLRLTRQEPTDDSSQTVSELLISRTLAHPELDESDEPLDIRPGKVIRISDPTSPHKALALRALQSKRLAEQLSVRQQSLPCSFEQASEWDIQHLVSETVAMLSDNKPQTSAALLLLSLVSGRSPELLVRDIDSLKLFQEIKGHPCLYLPHSVPASKQATDCDSILEMVDDHLILPLPSMLKGYQFGRSSPNNDGLKSILSDINERHQTRLTLGRVIRYLEHWYLNQGLDRAEIALIRGEGIKSRPALSYSNLDADPIIKHHRDYIDAIFNMAGVDPGMPMPRPIGIRLGSRLALPGNILHNLFDLLSPLQIKPRASLNDVITYHNHYAGYVWALLTFATGHRDVTAPMGQLGDYNRHSQTWWISDKENRHGLAARTVILPATAARQVELYLAHLRALAQRTRFVASHICEHCESVLAGSSNLLFAIMTPLDEEAAPADLCPSLLANLLGKQIPWARNWPRHHLRSELKRQGIAPEQIDGWMGHEDIGEEGLGRYSALSLHHLHDIADRIETLLKDHNIEALPGWQTR